MEKRTRGISGDVESGKKANLFEGTLQPLPRGPRRGGKGKRQKVIILNSGKKERCTLREEEGRKSCSRRGGKGEENVEVYVARGTDVGKDEKKERGRGSKAKGRKKNRSLRDYLRGFAAGPKEVSRLGPRLQRGGRIRLHILKGRGPTEGPYQKKGEEEDYETFVRAVLEGGSPNLKKDAFPEYKEKGERRGNRTTLIIFPIWSEKKKTLLVCHDFGEKREATSLENQKNKRGGGGGLIASLSNKRKRGDCYPIELRVVEGGGRETALMRSRRETNATLRKEGNEITVGE